MQLGLPKRLCFHYRGHGFNPGGETKDSTCCAVWKNKNKINVFKNTEVIRKNCLNNWKWLPLGEGTWKGSEGDATSFILCFIIFATFKKHCIGNPLVVRWLVLHTLLLRAQVWFLMGELKPHKPSGVAKNPQTNKNHCTYINLMEMKEKDWGGAL